MNITAMSLRSKDSDKIIYVLFNDGALMKYEYFEPVFVSPIKSSYIDNSDLLGYSFFREESEIFYFKTEVKYIEISKIKN